MRSRDVVDLLERFDLDVIYNFDRLEEGEPDTYTVRAAAEGFELRFDEKQRLEVIWCHVLDSDSFAPIDTDCIGVFIPDSMADAKRHAASTGHPVRISEGVGTSGFVRVDAPDKWVHYEFQDGELRMVTIMRPWE